MALSYCAFAFATLAYHLPCVRKSVTLHCDSRPAEMCVSPCLVPPNYPLLFSYSLHCHVK